MVHRLGNVANGIAHVTMIKAVLVVFAASKSFIKREFEVLRGSEIVASVGLPCKGRRHHLAAENVVVGSVIKYVHSLFFAPEKLHR